MRQSAPQARTLWVPAGLFSLLLSTFVGSGCTDVQDAGLGGEPAVVDGSLRGELAAYISDDLEGHSETRYALRDQTGAERNLVFDTLVKAADLQPGTEIRVWGNDNQDAFHVMHAEPSSAESPQFGQGWTVPGGPIGLGRYDCGRPRHHNAALAGASSCAVIQALRASTLIRRRLPTFRLRNDPSPRAR